MCMYVCVCVYVCTVRLFILEYVYVCLYERERESVCVCVCVYETICMYVCMYVCMYLCIYIYQITQHFFTTAIINLNSNPQGGVGGGCGRLGCGRRPSPCPPYPTGPAAAPGVREASPM